jgi:hypothetical protein
VKKYPFETLSFRPLQLIINCPNYPTVSKLCIYIFYTQQVEELELELEQQILRGSLLPPDTRVVHFKNNPLSAALEKDARQTADILRENEALKARYERTRQTVEISVGSGSGSNSFLQ